VTFVASTAFNCIHDIKHFKLRPHDFKSKGKLYSLRTLSRERDLKVWERLVLEEGVQLRAFRDALSPVPKSLPEAPPAASSMSTGLAAPTAVPAEAHVEPEAPSVQSAATQTDALRWVLTWDGSWRPRQDPVASGGYNSQLVGTGDRQAAT
jgi:hypothetical protein